MFQFPATLSQITLRKSSLCLESRLGPPLVHGVLYPLVHQAGLLQIADAVVEAGAEGGALREI